MILLIKAMVSEAIMISIRELPPVCTILVFFFSTPTTVLVTKEEGLSR